MQSIEVVNVTDLGRLEMMAGISILMMVVFFVLIVFFLFGGKKR